MPDFIGGPGRTRTCNQTVMSATGRLKIQTISAIRAGVCTISCSFVHGVSGGFLVGMELLARGSAVRHRKRRREGLHCLTIQLRETEIDVLIYKGLLKPEMRNSKNAIINALHAHFDLGFEP